MNKYSVGSKNGHCGFTLIELMILLVIAAILALIAYNVYTSYVGGAQHSNTKAALLETAQPMQQNMPLATNTERTPALFPSIRSPLRGKVADRSA